MLDSLFLFVYFGRLDKLTYLYYSKNTIPFSFPLRSLIKTESISYSKFRRNTRHLYNFICMVSLSEDPSTRRGCNRNTVQVDLTKLATSCN